MSEMPRIIGIDIDNTIICYERPLRRLARELGLSGPEAAGDKRAIRDWVRLLPDGEMRWRWMQAQVYGPLIREARPMEGVDAFLDRCRARGEHVRLVSHKTKRANAFDTGVDLRDAVMGWLRDNGFFDPVRSCLTPEHVHFEDTRHGKVRRIGDLGCAVFIDDLAETFLEPEFPSGVERVLFAPGGAPGGHDWEACCHDWDEVSERVLGAGGPA